MLESGFDLTLPAARVLQTIFSKASSLGKQTTNELLTLVTHAKSKLDVNAKVTGYAGTTVSSLAYVLKNMSKFDIKTVEILVKAGAEINDATAEGHMVRELASVKHLPAESAAVLDFSTTFQQNRIMLLPS